MKKRRTFDYDRNRKRVQRTKKNAPDIKCEQIRKAWDQKKSVKRNLQEMGLSADPNKTVKLPKNFPQSALVGNEEIEMETEKTPVKKFVAEELETKSKEPHRKRMTMSDEEAGFCVYMMDKHGDDYEAMTRDRKNYYQETAAKIRKKILRFKSIPDMYQLYADARPDMDADQQQSPTTTTATTTTTTMTCSSQSCGTTMTSVESFLSMAPHRCSTRLYDAGLRNGHFYSPPAASPSKSAIFAPNTTLCRVRKRLQFGRKAPKDRNGLDE